ncbi:hypothetical protein C1H46_041077 [Malus baccata]|uniref:Uncharacterized protein n=1 Tax=Malus baccata TaxID=106549 RepID=A0A540KGN5_MALBA|nr:hypothetical protein C1H46_041077 [Malus baccata]
MTAIALSDLPSSPTCIKITAIALLSLSFFLLANHYYATYPSLPFFSSTATSSAAQSPSLASQTPKLHAPNPPSAHSPPPLRPPLEVKRMGIVDEISTMLEELEA